MREMLVTTMKKTYIDLSGKSSSAASRRSSSAKWYSLRVIKISALPSSASGNDRGFTLASVSATASFTFASVKIALTRPASSSIRPNILDVQVSPAVCITYSLKSWKNPFLPERNVSDEQRSVLFSGFPLLYALQLSMYQLEVRLLLSTLYRSPRPILLNIAEARWFSILYLPSNTAATRFSPTLGTKRKQLHNAIYGSNDRS
ncbi:hypothetical protein PUN28_004088 [Cardiocondyla obscurior]|uniref:Uncharacterized protein n=1 Tax=Cardiocondyla obscurior TaxID=286306 RepID=A0AAW2GPI0_9HYME